VVLAVGPVPVGTLRVAVATRSATAVTLRVSCAHTHHCTHCVCTVPLRGTVHHSVAHSESAASLTTASAPLQHYNHRRGNANGRCRGQDLDVSVGQHGCLGVWRQSDTTTALSQSSFRLVLLQQHQSKAGNPDTDLTSHYIYPSALYFSWLTATFPCKCNRVDVPLTSTIPVHLHSRSTSPPVRQSPHCPTVVPHYQLRSSRWDCVYTQSHRSTPLPAAQLDGGTACTRSPTVVPHYQLRSWTVGLRVHAVPP